MCGILHLKAVMARTGMLMSVAVERRGLNLQSTRL